MRKPILSAGALVGVLLLLTLYLPHCRKAVIYDGELTPPELIVRARAFVSKEILAHPPVYRPGNPDNDRTRREKEILWNSAVITSFRGRSATIVPVHFEKDIFVKTSWGGNNNFRLDNQVKLLVYQDSLETWHAELVTALPDTVFLRSDQQKFSGIILVDDWWGNPINKYCYTPDGRVERYIPGQNTQDAAAPRQMATSVRAQGFVQVCTYIYGYNYAAGDPDSGESWVEFAGCSTMYAPDNGGGSGSGGAYAGVVGGGGGSGYTTSLSRSILFYTPFSIITNIRDYFKCFQPAAGAIFHVTVCVDQPSPGSRTPWVLQTGQTGSGSTNSFMVGHTFLLLTENMPGGWAITRNIGFYPSMNVTPASDPVPGVFNDDGGHAFNIAAQYDLSSAMFFNMLTYITNAAGSYYQANSNNCTNFVLSALEAAHIFLPHTIGYWPAGMGVNPGDLGEDIRGHDFFGMTRIITPFTHANIWNCD